jgi:hypothetical protein
LLYTNMSTWMDFFLIGYNMTSHNLIVFKSVVWKKGDESFRKNAILGLGVGSNPGPLAPKACALPMRHSTSTSYNMLPITMPDLKNNGSYLIWSWTMLYHLVIVIKLNNIYQSQFIIYVVSGFVYCYHSVNVIGLP